MFRSSSKIVGFSQLPETEREAILRKNKVLKSSRDRRKRQEIYATVFFAVALTLFVALSSYYCDTPSGNSKTPVYALEKK